MTNLKGRQTVRTSRAIEN